MSCHEQSGEQSPPHNAYLQAMGFDLPNETQIFQEIPEETGMPQELYILQDPKLIYEIDQGIEQGSFGLTSPAGTGKTALREITLREFGWRDNYLCCHLDDNAFRTGRRILMAAVQSLLEAGYEYDEDSVGLVIDDVPQEKSDLMSVLHQLISQAKISNNQVVIIADQVETYNNKQLETLCDVLYLGTHLLVLGTCTKRKLANKMPALTSMMRWHERIIRPFQAGHTAEYVAKSLAYAADRPYEGPSYSEDHSVNSFVEAAPIGPFTAGGIEEITGIAGGNPRLIRVGCLSSLFEAAQMWDLDENVNAHEVQIDRKMVEKANLNDWKCLKADSGGRRNQSGDP